MSNIKELIRQEIERRKVATLDKGFTFVPAALQDLLSFLDTLPDESEQPTRGYDEAYLNEKIAKASKSWEGVDADKFMDEVRGREPVTECNDFDSLFDEFCDTHPDGMTLEECGRFFFSRGFSRGKMVATNDFDLALSQRYLIGFNDGKREPVTDCHDLTEAAKKSAVQYYVDGGYSPFQNIETASHIAGFIAGAEWQKRKMIDDSYEEEVQEVYQDDAGIHCCVSVGTDYEPGTIVYVITILKDEEK